MHRLPSPTPALEQLFDPGSPGSAMLYSMLERSTPGEFLVDDPGNPSQCIVRSPSRITYASRGVTQAFFDEALTELRTTAGVALVRAPDHDEAWSPPEPDLIVERLEFLSSPREDGPLSDMLGRAYEGFEIRAIAPEEFKNPLWHDTLLGFSGSAESFFGCGFGLVLRKDGEPIAWTYAPCLGRSAREIGVETAEAHRGKGYATFIAAHAVKECQQRGHRAIWSCETDNPASAAIARKLGFDGERTYRVFAYRSVKP
jgi:RimJ/RimL family protein N-acetyltransferase